MENYGLLGNLPLIVKNIKSKKKWEQTRKRLKNESKWEWMRVKWKIESKNWKSESELYSDDKLSNEKKLFREKLYLVII